jgi:hypothetical protein
MSGCGDDGSTSGSEPGSEYSLEFFEAPNEGVTPEVIVPAFVCKRFKEERGKMQRGGGGGEVRVGGGGGGEQCR